MRTLMVLREAELVALRAEARYTDADLAEFRRLAASL